MMDISEISFTEHNNSNNTIGEGFISSCHIHNLNDEIVVNKVFNPKYKIFSHPAFLIWKYALKMEVQNLHILEDINNVPNLLGVQKDNAIVRTYIAGIERDWRWRPSRKEVENLEYLVNQIHTKGLANLDIGNPANIVLTDNDQIGLIDFNSAFQKKGVVSRLLFYVGQIEDIYHIEKYRAFSSLGSRISRPENLLDRINGLVRHIYLHLGVVFFRTHAHCKGSSKESKMGPISLNGAIAIVIALIVLSVFSLADKNVVTRLSSKDHKPWWVNYCSRLLPAIAIILLTFNDFTVLKITGILLCYSILTWRFFISVLYLLTEKSAQRFQSLHHTSYDQQIAGYLYYILLPMLRRYFYFLMLFAVALTGTEQITEMKMFEISSPSSIMFVDFLYFTVITATTLGYGDILPISSIAKLLTILIVLGGIYFLVVGFASTLVFLSQLISRK